jgi:hypothetical protein
MNVTRNRVVTPPRRPLRRGRTLGAVALAVTGGVAYGNTPPARSSSHLVSG